MMCTCAYLHRKPRRRGATVMRAWWSLPWGSDSAGSDNAGGSLEAAPSLSITNDGSAVVATWWREHPVRDDVWLGWVQHPDLAAGERCDLQVEFINSGGGVWTSRKMKFEGGFIARSVPPCQIRLRDDISELDGVVNKPELVCGEFLQRGVGGGSFELRALPAGCRIWWDFGPSRRSVSAGNAGSARAMDNGEEDPQTRAPPGFEILAGPKEPDLQIFSGRKALFDLLTGARVKLQEDAQRNRRKSADALAHVRSFSMTPEDVKAYLDRFVIKQDAAKEALAVAICDHYNRVREVLAQEEDDEGEDEDESQSDLDAAEHTSVVGRYTCHLPPEINKPVSPADFQQLQSMQVAKDGRVLSDVGEETIWRINTSDTGKVCLLSHADVTRATLHMSSDQEVVWKFEEDSSSGHSGAFFWTWTRLKEPPIIADGSKAGSGDVDLPEGPAQVHGSTTAGQRSTTNYNYMKPNVLLLGPTGSGKTYVMKNLAEMVGVPFVKADATKFTETGYVGRNAEDVLQDLLTAADGDTAMAQCGIVYVDEIDKVCGNDQSSLGNFRKGVQNTFLKLMEEAEIMVPTGPPQMMGQAGKRLSTRFILFVFSGAFTPLNDRLREERAREMAGFGFVSDMEGKAQLQLSDVELTSFLHEAGTEDLVKAGLEPEFVGRIPVRVALSSLSEDDLFRILAEAEGGAGTQLVEDFRRYGIRLHLTDGALRAVAKKAIKEKTGARSLVTVLENTLRRFKFRLPALVPSGCTELEVTEKVVEDPDSELELLLARYRTLPGGEAPSREVREPQEVVESKLVTPRPGAS